MKLRFDEDTGRVSVSLGDEHGDDRWIRLRRPRLRQWADWSEAAAQLADRTRSAIEGPTVAAPGDLSALYDDVVTAGPQAALNWEMIRELAAVELPSVLDDDSPVRLWLSDPDITHKLISFWWNCPLAPWDDTARADDSDLAPPPTPAGRGNAKEQRRIGTELPGSLGVLSVIYQALMSVGMGAGWEPPAVDNWEIWQVAVALGRDGPAGHVNEAGAEVRTRSDGQVDSIGFGRDPNLPRMFGEGSSWEKAWAYITNRRKERQRRAEREALTANSDRQQRAPRRQRRGGSWRPTPGP